MNKQTKGIFSFKILPQMPLIFDYKNGTAEIPLITYYLGLFLRCLDDVSW